MVGRRRGGVRVPRAHREWPQDVLMAAPPPQNGGPGEQTLGPQQLCKRPPHRRGRGRLIRPERRGTVGASHQDTEQTQSCEARRRAAGVRAPGPCPERHSTPVGGGGISGMKLMSEAPSATPSAPLGGSLTAGGQHRVRFVGHGVFGGVGGGVTRGAGRAELSKCGIRNGSRGCRVLEPLHRPESLLWGGGIWACSGDDHQDRRHTA